jgi:predicted RNA-binding protein with PIN domain
VTAIVLVDAENVRRSVWPNIGRDELVERATTWADAHGVRASIVFEGAESADDRIAAEAAGLHARGEEVWVATSDRELRRRVEPYVTRTIGGGALAREL